MLCSKGEKITAKAHNGLIDIEGVTVAQVDDQVRLQKVETWFDPLEMFRQIAPNGIVNKEVLEPHHLDEDKDQEEHRAAQTDETNTDSKTVEKATSITLAGSIEIPQGQNTTDSPSKPNPKSNVVSGASDLHSPSVTRSKEEVEATSSDSEAQVEEHKDVTTAESDKPLAQIDGDSAAPPNSINPLGTSTQSKENDQLTPDSTRVTTPDSDSKPQVKALEDTDDPDVEQAKSSAVTNEVPTPAADSLATGVQSRSKDETGIAEPRLSPNDITNQMNRLLQALESVKTDLRQLSARADNIESRIHKPEGVSPNATESAPSPGNAFAAAPDGQETRQTHEEMSRISAGECPFLMNQE